MSRRGRVQNQLGETEDDLQRRQHGVCRNESAGDNQKAPGTDTEACESRTGLGEPCGLITESILQVTLRSLDFILEAVGNI